MLNPAIFAFSTPITSYFPSVASWAKSESLQFDYSKVPDDRVLAQEFCNCVHLSPNTHSRDSWYCSASNGVKRPSFLRAALALSVGSQNRTLGKAQTLAHFHSCGTQRGALHRQSCNGVNCMSVVIRWRRIASLRCLEPISTRFFEKTFG